jgi:hypothetical protein
MPRDTAATAHPGLDNALAWLDCLIEREILRLRARYELSLDELRGLYISDQLVDALIRQKHQASATDEPVGTLSARAQQIAPQHECASPLGALRSRLQLSETALDIVLLALAPELDIRYESLYGYLNDDIARRHVTIQLAQRLLQDARRPGSDRALEVRSLLTPTSPLVAGGLIELLERAPGRSSLQQGIAAAPLLSHFACGLPLVDPRWPSAVGWFMPEPAPAISGPDPTVESVRAFNRALVVGDDATDRRNAASEIATRLGWPLLRLPLSCLVHDARQVTLRSAALAIRLVSGALLLDDDLATTAPSEVAAALRHHAGAGTRFFLLGRREARWAESFGDFSFARIDLEVPDAAMRAQLWAHSFAQLGITNMTADAPAVAELARRYPIGPARIAAAARAALPRAGGVSSGEDVARHASAEAALRANDSLAHLATCVRRLQRWEHLVVADSTMRQLREIADAIACRDQVYHRWGMLQRTGRSAGLALLFTGGSGTGKTMAASVLANETRLTLYRIDLASVVSKYIGETEQNLDRIFVAARHASAILMFDEADAILGKRSEVKDAHDRYANLEVAYLLQKLEDHDGVVVLASNLPKNIDSAFTRRMNYSVEFAKPSVDLRERLWKGMFPSDTPLDGGIEFRFLAEKFETTGGDIQAIALDAAFLAAARGGPITMDDLMHAVVRRQTRQGNPGGMARFRDHQDALAAPPRSLRAAGSR